MTVIPGCQSHHKALEKLGRIRHRRAGECNKQARTIQYQDWEQRVPHHKRNGGQGRYDTNTNVECVNIKDSFTGDEGSRHHSKTGAKWRSKGSKAEFQQLCAQSGDSETDFGRVELGLASARL